MGLAFGMTKNHIRPCWALAILTTPLGVALIVWGVVAENDPHRTLLMLGLGCLALIGSGGLLCFGVVQNLRDEIRHLATSLTSEDKRTLGDSGAG